MKEPRSLFSTLFPSYWLLTLAVIAVTAAGAFLAVQSFYFRSLEADLFTRATLFARHLRAAPPATWNARCREAGALTETRFTVVLPDGTVAADSAEDPARMENHAGRPEIRKVLDGAARGVERRFSRTLGRKMMYVARPLRGDDGRLRGVVRAALPMTAVEAPLRRLLERLLAAALFAGLLSLLPCALVARRISRPLGEMSRAALRFAEGDFRLRIPRQTVRELDDLSRALNRMAERLEKTMRSLAARRNEQRAILAGLEEGVLAVGADGRVLLLNRAAGRFLGLDPEAVRGCPLDTLDIPDRVRKLAEEVLHARDVRSCEIEGPGGSSLRLHVSGRLLHDENEKLIGVLIVLRDITRLRRLETVRSDFVANVSHELKTPVTAVKGFVETLLDSEWNHDPQVRRFLEIIRRQTDRLGAIIDDLLTLSRLEQQTDGVARRPAPMGDLLSSAADLCRPLAREKDIRIEVEPVRLIHPLNAPLIEQALVNLLSNAIKYSDPGKTVRISARREEGRLIIRVADEGFGIAPEHLDRIFERFYRVDTARSRDLGGTGLGLSIVKHIVQAHGGSIRVESTPGRGSTFIVELP